MESRDQRVPSYIRIADHLEERILSQGIGLGEQILPERELAKEYGVSRMTVRHALERLDRKGYVSRSRSRGTIVIRSRPNARHGRTIGFLFPFVTTPRDRVLYKVEQVLGQEGYSIIVGNTLEDPTIEARKIRELVDQGVEGLIVIPSYGRFDICPNTTLFEEVGRRLPIVLAQRPVNANVDIIATDEIAGGFTAAMHLVDQGHRRIAYIHVPGSPLSELRRLGYVKALREASLQIDPKLIVSIGQSGDAALPLVYAAVTRLIDDHDPPTAFMAYNDILISAVIYAVQDAGRSIPDDIAAVGYDNSDVAGAANPPITSIDRRSERVGELASQRLLSRIAGGNKLPAEPIWVLPALIERLSSVTQKAISSKGGESALAIGQS